MARWRQVLEPPEKRRRLRRHVESRLQPFRARTLIACGAVSLDAPGGGLARASDPDRVLEPGQKVYVDRPYPPACRKAFERIPSSDYVDYGFAPGTGSFEDAIRAVLQAKAGVRVIEGPQNLVDIFRFLRFAAPRPIRSIYLGAHSWIGGRLSIRATPTSSPYGPDYDALQELHDSDLLGFTDAEVQPRPRDARGKTVPLDVHIRGCRLGIAKPWLELFKRALWSRVGDKSAVGRVTAPKHFQVAGRYDPPDGATEYMYYGFGASSPQRLTNRADIVRALHLAGHRTIDGKRVPYHSWNAWVPSKGFDAEHSGKTQIVLPLDGHRHDVDVHYTVREDSAQFAGRLQGQLPASQKDRVAFVLAQVRQSIANGKLPMFADDHPFPVFRRNGYASLEAYVKAFSWWPGQLADGTAVVQGRRTLYAVRRPVVEHGDRLLVNFYPSFRGKEVVMMRESDSRLFESV